MTVNVERMLCWSDGGVEGGKNLFGQCNSRVESTSLPYLRVVNDNPLQIARQK
jgi:hypothetical protein